MGNSIELALEPLKENVAIEAFRLQLNSEFANNKVLVLVEGTTDKNFYKKIFNQNVYLHKSEYGCGHFLCILDKFQNKYGNRFIVLKDADFDLVNSVDYSMYSNLFITDYHDTEIMTAFLGNKIENIITTKFLNTSENGLFEGVLKDISIISFIKWYNSCATRNIGTNDLISCYVVNSKLTIEKCLEKQKHKHGTSFDKEDIKKFISNHISVDKKLITNGHDFCNALGKNVTAKRMELKNSGINSFKKVGISEECIQKELNNNFSINDFLKTNMYKSISNWQLTNNCNILAI